MSTSINPEDYNIDKLNTGILGPIETTDFRDYILSYNLPGTVEQVTSEGGSINAGDFIGYDEKIKDLPTVNDEAVSPRTRNMSENEYGPSEYGGYSIDYSLLPIESETGFEPYKTRVGGNFKSTILGQQIGFSPGSGIDYDSQLSDIGKEQRKFNTKERIKLNFVDETVGKLNIDPIGLLSGQDLFLKDYTITKAPGLGGKALDFAEKLSGFKIPTSLIPSWKSVDSNEGYDVNQDLLNFTSEGTKGLLYEAINQNKWGPRFQGGGKPDGPKTKVGKFIKKVDDSIDGVFGGGDLPLTTKYTDPVRPSIIFEEETPLVDRLNETVSNAIDSAKRKITPTVVPIEGEQPTSEKDPTLYSGGLGFEIDKRVFNYKDEKTKIDNFNSSPEAKIYGSSFKVTTTQSNDEIETTSEKNTFFWSSQNKEKAKRGLLRYTQKLINESIEDDSSSAKFIGIVNDNKNFNGNDNTKHQVFSQGNRVRSGGGEDDVYCRSWSIRNPYSRYSDTIRSEKLRREKLFQELSVLEDNGMPKIVPYIEDYKDTNEGANNPQKYMLSLENLAWKGSKEYNSLAPLEKGPNGGRMMWFPPYDISFNDNTSVNWDSTSFIGRGEPVYTYNNTERSGNLSFSIVVDHPSSLTDLRSNAQSSLERYFAGCGDEKSGFEEFDEDVVEPEIYEEPKPIERPSGSTPKLTFYFQNAKTKDSPGRDIDTDLSVNYQTRQPTINIETEETTPAGLNYTFEEDLEEMCKFLLTQEGKRYQIISEGFTSALNITSYNKVLGKDRAKSLKDYLKKELLKKETEINQSVEWPQKIEGKPKTFPRESEWQNNTIRWSEPISRGESFDSGRNKPLTGKETPEELQKIINDPKAVKGRRATIRLVYNKEIDELMESKVYSEVEQINKDRKAEFNRKNIKIKETAQLISNRLVNEATYFNKIQREDSFIYDTFKSKIKNFHPAFHSMTPEGLNSRITYLKQCTRQGPNYNTDEPSNLTFGKPPIVILRVGDLYHTKIVISSMNLTYEPLIWDLNPEGIGVQPMIAKVDMNFSFIGGSSLEGPINELQNAVSFNFFANTSVYNKRRQVKLKKGNFESLGSEGEIYEYGSYIGPNQKLSPPSDDDINPNNESSNTNDDINTESPFLYDGDTDSSGVPITELDEVVITNKPKTRVLKISSLNVGKPCGVEPNVRVIETKLKLENYSDLTDTEKENFIFKGLSINIIGEGLFYSEEITTTNIESTFNIGDEFLGNCGTKGVPKIKKDVEYDIQLVYENEIISSNFFTIGQSDDYVSLF